MCGSLIADRMAAAMAAVTKQAAQMLQAMRDFGIADRDLILAGMSDVLVDMAGREVPVEAKPVEELEGYDAGGGKGKSIYVVPIEGTIDLGLAPSRIKEGPHHVGGQIGGQGRHRQAHEEEVLQHGTTPWSIR